MKAQILKISGHKNEKDFYNEFPTMESFMAKHGAKLRKAQGGSKLGGNPYYGFPEPVMDQTEEIFNPSSVIKPYQYSPEEQAKKSIAQGEQITGIEQGANAGAAKAMDTGQAIQTGIGMVDSVIGGFKALKAEKKALKSARTWRDVSGAALEASKSKDVNTNQTIADTAKRTRKALMPEVTGEELFPVYGVGTNVLAKDGRKMFGGGEIMNTFAPGDIYDDLGYEPLEESSTYQPLNDEEIVKAYRSGGLISKYQLGGMFSGMGQNFMSTLGGTNPQASSPWAVGGNAAAGIAGSAFGNNAGTQIGGGIGEGIGSLFGPIGGAVGKFAGTAIGGLLDKNPKKQKKAQEEMMRNVGIMSGMSGIKDFQTSNSGVMEDGGNLTNPRVITHFGDHSMRELLARDPYMDTLRFGGNIRQNSVGDIQAISGGHLEPMSYNPYDDGSGYTSMIKGQSHEESNGRHTGVLMKYNKAASGMEMSGADVEAENNEPIKEIGNDAVIFGDIVINDRTVKGDPQFKDFYGKTFKKAMEKVAKEDNKLNKQQAKNTKALNDLDVRTPIDKLTLNSLSMNERGIDTRYKVNSALTKKASDYQEIVNSTADELGLDAGAFSRGKVKPSINGIAQDGTTVEGGKTKFKKQAQAKDRLPSSSIGDFPDVPEWASEQTYGDVWKPKVYGAFADNARFTNILNYLENYQGEGAENLKGILADIKDPQKKRDFLLNQATNKEIGPIHTLVREAIDKTKPETPPTGTTDEVPKDEDKIFEVNKYKKYGWENLAGEIMPWLRKQPGEDLLGDQLAGEMYAMSQNQEEPVQARFKHSLLDVPYDISYQDQLNENQADFNSLVRRVGDNPEALGALAGQKYAANSKVLAEQFRANQAKKDQVYSQNRAILNADQQFNLGIADQQYVRQQQAKSNTKETMQTALNSIASKIGQNRLENRTLQTYANMFPDFSYDKNMRIRKTGAPANIDIPVIYNQETGEPTHVLEYDSKGSPIGYKSVKPETTAKKKEEIIPIPSNATTPITNPVTPKNNTTKTMATSSSTGPTLADDKKKKRYGGLVKAFKNI